MTDRGRSYPTACERPKDLESKSIEMNTNQEPERSRASLIPRSRIKQAALA